VAVNISAHQFQRSDLVPRVLRILEETGVQGQRLQLEITEGTAAQNPERAMRTMAALQEHRIRFALDDFGTGYSSMSYLKRFPIDTVKIDRSFVNGLPENQDDAAIASSVIAMSHALGLKVVAEGIENERQALLLKSLKCDEVQGFLYGKAMPADRATQVLQHGLSVSQ
jgi:EAL domain-containing protein (putative c-di-GMP-specific phosphodiesterase class I)